MFLISNSVDHLDHLEYHKCQKDEVDRDGDEIAIGKDGNACFFEGIKCAGYVVRDCTKNDKEVGEINSTPQKSGN